MKINWKFKYAGFAFLLLLLGFNAIYLIYKWHIETLCLNSLIFFFIAIYWFLRTMDFMIEKKKVKGKQVANKPFTLTMLTIFVLFLLVSIVYSIVDGLIL